MYGSLGAPIPVEGTDLESVPLSAEAMLEWIAGSSLPEAERMVAIAQQCTMRRGSDEHAWPTLEACKAAPWPVVKAAGEAALRVNGLTEDPVGDAEGN